MTYITKRGKEKSRKVLIGILIKHFTSNMKEIPGDEGTRVTKRVLS